MQDNQGLDPYQSPRADVDMGNGYEDEGYDENGVFTFQGRIGRLKYWTYSILSLVAIYAALGVLAAIFVPMLASAGDSMADGFPIIFVVLYLLLGVVVTVIGCMFAARRCRDLGLNPWLSLVTIIPFVNFFFWLYLQFAPGNKGANEYGPPPAPNSTLMKVLGWGSLLLIPAAIGILAAVALPAYQDYVNRAKAAQAGFEQSMEGMENMDIESDADAEAVLEELMREMEGGDADAAGAAIDGAVDATTDAIQDGATELGGAMSDAELDKLLQELESNDGQGAEVLDGAVDGTVNDNMLLDGGAEMSQEEAKKELEKLLKELEQAENELQNQPQ